MSKISERLAAIRARCDAATPGPWRSITIIKEDDFADHQVDGPGWADTSLLYEGADAAFIAHSRADLPALLAVAEAAERLTGLASPWWAWGECVGCGAEAGPPNLTGYNHADDCPAIALDAALVALGGEA